MLLILEGDELSDIVLGNYVRPLQHLDAAQDNALIIEGPLFYQWKLAFDDWNK